MDGMSHRIFTAEELETLGVIEMDPGETDEESGVTVISDEIVEHKRWSVRHHLVFRIKDQPVDEAYRVSYYVPATECQEQDPWNEAGKIKATIVRRVTKTIETWE